MSQGPPARRLHLAIDEPAAVREMRWRDLFPMLPRYDLDVNARMIGAYERRGVGERRGRIDSSFVAARRVMA